MEQKKLLHSSKERLGLWGLNKKLQATGTMARQSGSIESRQNFSRFSIHNIHIQTGCYKNGIYRLFANFLSCKITRYY